MRERVQSADAIGIPLFCYFVDQVYEDVTDAFLVDEWLAKKMGSGELDRPVIHLWQHPNALVLGMKERWLPRIGDAVERWQSEKQIQTISRISGGAAVPLDMGVLNVSVIWPANPGMFQMNEDFECFAQWIDWMMGRIVQCVDRLKEVKTERGEIVGAYCPGAYDLSIAGKKIGGLAQRRPLASRIWQAYINVTGNGPARAASVAEWYATAGADGLAGAIRPDQTACLADFYMVPEDPAQWKQSIIEALSGRVTRIEPLSEMNMLAISIQEWREQLRNRFKPIQ